MKSGVKNIITSPRHNFTDSVIDSFPMVQKLREAEDLAEYVELVMREKGLNTQDIAERSNGGIDRSYISKILSRSVTNLSMDKIAALARGLGVRPKEVALVALGQKPQGEGEFKESRFYELFTEYERLDEKTKADFDAAIDMLLRGARKKK